MVAAVKVKADTDVDRVLGFFPEDRGFVSRVSSLCFGRVPRVDVRLECGW